MPLSTVSRAAYDLEANPSERTHGVCQLPWVGHDWPKPHGVVLLRVQRGGATLTRALFVKWARHNIRVNAVAPEVHTSVTQRICDDPALHASAMLRVILLRVAEPAYVSLADRVSRSAVIVDCQLQPPFGRRGPLGKGWPFAARSDLHFADLEIQLEGG